MPVALGLGASPLEPSKLLGGKQNTPIHGGHAQHLAQIEPDPVALGLTNQQNGLASVVIRSNGHGSKLAKHPLCALLSSTLHPPKQHQHQQLERDQDHHG